MDRLVLLAPLARTPNAVSVERAFFRRLILSGFSGVEFRDLLLFYACEFVRFEGRR